MMKLCRWTSVFFVVLVLAVLLGASSGFGKTKQFDLFYSNFFPAPHKQCVLADEWGKEIAKRTNGQVTINLVPGGTLTPADKCFDGVVKGISHVGMSFFAYTPGKFPLLEVLDLPLGFKSGKAATTLANEFQAKFNPRELKDVKVMYLTGHGPGIIHTKKPVARLEDLEGMKIRATGTSARIIQALGGLPVAMPMSDAYDALSKGVVDGIIGPVESLEGWRLGEVTGFSTNMGVAYSLVSFVVMNKDIWNSLPPEAQTVIDEVNAEWIGKAGAVWDGIDQSGLDYATKRGHKITNLTPEEQERWTKAVQPLLDDYVSRMKSKNLPGQEALQFCQDRLKTLE